MHRAVIVVGAGPVGLSAALALRARGLDATVLEAGPVDRLRPGSRAIYTHRASLELLDRMRPGLGQDLAAHGLVWPTRRTVWRGREVFTRTYSGPVRDGFPPFTSLPQVETERHLLEACKAADVELVWDADIEQVEPDPGGVTLRTASGGQWSADYVIGADGGRSAVRRGIGVAMEGSRSETSFVIVDVAEDSEQPLPIERIFHYEHPLVDGRNVLLVPFRGGWRADLQCRRDDDPEEFSGPKGVQRWIAASLGERYADRVTWVSTYQFMQVVADEFTDVNRRVLLAGEAAHLFAPFGARGMNSGIADADAAASALRIAVGANAGTARAAIEDFARARRQAAEYNRAAASQALAHMQALDPITQIRRHAAAATAAVWPAAGEWLDTAPYGPRGGPPGGGAGKY